MPKIPQPEGAAPHVRTIAQPAYAEAVGRVLGGHEWVSGDPHKAFLCFKEFFAEHPAIQAQFIEWYESL